MSELGIKNYHILPTRFNIDSGQTKQYVKAYNEYYYLISDNIPSDLIVHSDNNIFFSKVQQSGQYFPQEFTGMISIESSHQEAFTLDFIRVIPE